MISKKIKYDDMDEDEDKPKTRKAQSAEPAGSKQLHRKVANKQQEEQAMVPVKQRGRSRSASRRCVRQMYIGD